MIIEFPYRESFAPTTSGASKTEIYLGRLKEFLCGLLYKYRVPAFISDCEINDQFTGQQIVIKNWKQSTKITINGRDYYFDRITGRFTGTGIGCG